MNLLLRRLIKIILLQIFIYSFLTEWIINFVDGSPINFYLEAIVLIFLVFPISLLLLIKETTARYEIELRNINLLLLLFFTLPILHLFVLFKYDIFNRRIGTENLALIFGEMGFIDKAIMRVYDLSQSIFLVVGFFVLKLNTQFKKRGLFKAMYYINLVYAVIFALFNGRSALLVLMLLIITTDGLFVLISSKIKRIFVFFAIISFVAVSAIRYLPLIIIGYNNDFKEVLKNEILYRVNCTKLFNEVYVMSKHKGFLYGETIISPFISIQALLGDVDAKDKIQTANTGSKQYLLETYLGKDNKDDCSCAVVDSYANFAEFGIVFLLFIYLFWFYVIYWITKKKELKAYHICILISIVSSILLYEADGLSLLLNIVKYIPVFILFYFLNPFVMLKIEDEK